MFYGAGRGRGRLCDFDYRPQPPPCDRQPQWKNHRHRYGTGDTPENPLRPKRLGGSFEDDEEFLAIEPPAKGEEFPRPESSQSSYAYERSFFGSDTCSPEEILKQRNTAVRNWVPRKDPHDERLKDKKKNELSDEEFEASYESDSNIEAASFDGRRNIRFILEMLKQEETWRNQNQIDCLQKSDIQKNEPGGVNFSHYGFQRSVQVKWMIIRMERLEKLFRDKELSPIPMELMEYAVEFQKIYGPGDQSSLEYKNILNKFMLERWRKVIEMLEHECNVAKKIVDGTISEKDRENEALAVSRRLSELENELMTIPEAKVDMNPFASMPLRLDFFSLPRPKLPIESYVIRPIEMDNFVEFIKENPPIEGYNPVVSDVALTYPETIVSGFEWLSIQEEDVQNEKMNQKVKDTRKILDYLDSFRRVTKMSQILMKHPFGIEAKTFFIRFRESQLMFDEEDVFGARGQSYSDDEGVAIMSDVFFPQKVGEGVHERVILFHSRFRGHIGTPESILRKIWKRLRLLVEVQENHCLDLETLNEEYEFYFSNKIYPIDWGFKDVSDFVQYCLKAFHHKLKRFEVMNQEKYKEYLRKEESHLQKQDKSLKVELNKLGKGLSDSAMKTLASYCSANDFFLPVSRGESMGTYCVRQIGHDSFNESVLMGECEMSMFP